MSSSQHTTQYTTRQLRDSPEQLSALADGIAEQGLLDHARAAVGLANLLHCEGFRHIAIDILRDETQPEVARERAFGLVHGIALQAQRPARVGRSVAV